MLSYMQNQNRKESSRAIASLIVHAASGKEDGMIEHELSNGVRIPVMGYGVFQMTSDEVREHLPEAIAMGYRHVDTANGYYNEVAVGDVIAQSGIPREDFFVTTKLWPRDYGHEDCGRAIDASLERLGMDYADLMLLHQPYGAYTEAWHALEEALADGRVRAIGLSNFPKKKLQEILDVATVEPHVLQMEINPRCNQHDMKEWLEPRGVTFEGWYPLGHGDADLLEIPVIRELADKYGKTPAQIVLGWSIQDGNVVFPKTLDPEHMRQNLDVFDFELIDDEMRRIAAIPQKPYYDVPDEAPAFIADMPPFDQQL